jgi:hypothetical protein
LSVLAEGDSDCFGGAGAGPWADEGLSGKKTPKRPPMSTMVRTGGGTGRDNVSVTLRS